MSDWRNIDLDDLEGYEFQSLVAELLSRMGFVVEGSAVGPDGGKHLLAHSSAPVVGGKYVVQCKRLTGTVPEHVVRELYDVVRSEDAVKGILFTTSDFSLPSRRFAENKPLELIDGQSLRDLLRTHMPETAATSSESEWQVPAHFELLCKQLNKLLNPIWEEWDGLRNGPVHLQPQRVDSLGALGGLIGADMHQLAELIGTLAPVLTTLVAVSSAGDTVLAAERFAGYVMRVLQMRRSASAVVPPSGCEDLKSSWLAVLDEQLLKARKFHEDLERIRESPERAVDPEGLVRVTMDFTSQAGDRLKQLIDQRTSMLPQRISGCAVVTACFGDEQAPEVVRLRRWRDEVLSRSRGGRFVTSVYAAMSPSIAWLFRRSPVLGALGRAVVRKVLGSRA